jgi:carboxymethylenebutenolidase
MDPASEAMPKNAYQLAGEVKAPVLGLYGGDDTGITPDQVERMKAALQAAGKTEKFKIYPGAPHGFYADYRPSYRKEAADDAWQEMQDWFKTYGVLTK